MLQGRSYDPTFGTDAASIIVNETAVKVMGLKDPVGKIMQIWGKDKTIVGVVKDFNFQSLHEKLNPCFLELIDKKRATKMMVKLNTHNIGATLAGIETLYRQEYAGLPFEYRFFSDDYAVLYEGETKMLALSKYFTALAIIITCLGLLGFAAFTARQKQKEMGIRKVLGAPVHRILILLGRELLKPVLFSFLLSVPVAWWLMRGWLAGFEYRVTISAAVFGLAAAMILVSSVAVILFQLLRTALANPVNTLKQ